MDYKHIATQIIKLKTADLELRDKLIQEGELTGGYNEEMEQLHRSNAKALNEIIDSIGYPSISKVGKEASEAAWLVIQHSIAHPDFMKKCARLLKLAVDKDDASPKSLAYLTDRIAVFESRPQLYGTQFDWDESGALSPQPYDDLTLVNQRRASIGLHTLEEQTDLIRNRAEKENEVAPSDFEKRKNEYDEWRKEVGWI